MKSVFLALVLLFSGAFAQASNDFDSHRRRGGYEEDRGYGGRHHGHGRHHGREHGRYDRGGYDNDCVTEYDRESGYGRCDEDRRGPDYDRGPDYGRGPEYGQAPYGGFPLPFGSYVRSCTNCQVGPQVLTCVCSNSRRQLFTSSVFYNLCRRVGNFEGQLVCE